VKPRRETDKQTDNTTRQNSNAKSSLLQNKPKIHKLANVAMSSHRNGEREEKKRALLRSSSKNQEQQKRKKQTNKQQRVEAANNNKF
jgi:hypothetical protein